MIRKVIIITITLLLCFSCASTEFLMAKAKVTMYQKAYPPKDENSVIDVYRTQNPDKKYLEIAEITCADTDDKWAMDQIIIKAREIGADGIIIIGRAASYGYGVPIGNMVYASSEAYGLKAVAIKYIED